MFSWLTRFIERHPFLHRISLFLWRRFPPRLAGFLKGILAKPWLVGAVAVMIDETTSPPEVLLVKHSYRPQGAWGLPGGSLDAARENHANPVDFSFPDDIVEYALRREILEELGIGITVEGLIRIAAIPYVVEEPGTDRLTFYFRCVPNKGFSEFRRDLSTGQIKPRSAEIQQIRLVPLTDLKKYDLFSSDVKFLEEDLPRLEPGLASMKHG